MDDNNRTPPGDAFDTWVADTARAEYRASDRVPREKMWAGIRAARQDGVAIAEPPARVLPLSPRRPAWAMRVTALAAAVLLGVGLTRVFDAVRPSAVPGVAVRGANDGAPGPLVHAAILEHLGQSEVLLTAARAASRGDAPPTDQELADWARDLLSTTRLLRDANDSRDARLDVLLDDLELALAQLMQYHRSGRARDAAALRETLTDRDLLTRLHGASAPPMPVRDDLPRTE